MNKMLKKIAEQMEYRIIEGPAQTAVLRGRVLLLADRLLVPEGKACTFEETVDWEGDGMARYIHSFFYGELKADLREIGQAVVAWNLDYEEQVQNRHDVIKKINDLLEKIG